MFKLFVLIFLVVSNSFAANCSSLDKALENGLASKRHCFKIPYLKEGYIPQGLHITSKNVAYISMYHKDSLGVSHKNSIVAEINKSTGKVRKYTLPTKSHVGGLAVFNKYSKFVVPDGKNFCIYNKYNLKRGYCQKQSIGSSKRTSGFSFIHYATDHKGVWHMWAGQFEVGKKSKNGMHIFGYKVSGSKISKSPTYRFYVPPSVNRVQGVSVIAPKNKNGIYNILVSQSYGDHPSTITLLKYKRYEKYHYKYKHSGNMIVYTAPAGLEEIHATRTTKGVWTLFESGAKYYDKKWKSKAMPFLYRIPFNELGL